MFRFCLYGNPIFSLPSAPFLAFALCRAFFFRIGASSYNTVSAAAAAAFLYSSSSSSMLLICFKVASRGKRLKLSIDRPMLFRSLPSALRVEFTI
jgi:hypothetical protein